MKLAIYPGSFDPITNGHLDLINRAIPLFDKIIVAIADNVEKEKGALFTMKQREKMVKESLKNMNSSSGRSPAFDGGKVEVMSFKGLLAVLAKKTKAFAILRGLRAVSDFEYEFQMALMNRKLAPQTETFFLMPSEKYTYLSSSLIKDIARFNGDISEFVPKVVEMELKKKFGFR